MLDRKFCLTVSMPFVVFQPYNSTAYSNQKKKNPNIEEEFT